MKPPAISTVERTVMSVLTARWRPPSPIGIQRLRRVSAVAGGDILYRLSRILIRPSSVRCIGCGPVNAARTDGHGVILASWHSFNLLALIAHRCFFAPRTRGVIMVTPDWKGSVLRRYGRRWDLDVVTMGADATSAQSARAIATMIRQVRAGADGLIAVDGPSGPAFQVKPGAAFIAQRAGAVIVPTVAVVDHAISVRWRWDKHIFPLPGSHIVVLMDTPIEALPATSPPPGVEELRLRLANALQRLGEEAPTVVEREGFSA
jgi:lysophospholipid acyltransferase (LPLAT)-like uncharacterized protein